MTHGSKKLVLFAVVGALALAFAMPALAGDGAASAPSTDPKTSPAPAAPAADAKPAESTAPAATAPAADAPKTPSPIHTMMMWVGKQVMGDGECKCPSTPEGAKAWRAWFAGGKDVPLAGLRDALVATGWTADRTIGFFEEMKKSSAGGCCEGKCGGDCAGCNKSGETAKADGASKTDGASKCGDGECKCRCKAKAKAEGEAKPKDATPTETPAAPEPTPAAK